MKIRELYLEAYNNNHYGLKLMIHFLVKEKKVLSLEDDESKLVFYITQFMNGDKINKLLSEYERKLKHDE